MDPTTLETPTSRTSLYLPVVGKRKEGLSILLFPFVLSFPHMRDSGNQSLFSLSFLLSFTTTSVNGKNVVPLSSLCYMLVRNLHSHTHGKDANKFHPLCKKNRTRHEGRDNSGKRGVVGHCTEHHLLPSILPIFVCNLHLSLSSFSLSILHFLQGLLSMLRSPCF